MFYSHGVVRMHALDTRTAVDSCRRLDSNRLNSVECSTSSATMSGIPTTRTRGRRRGRPTMHFEIPTSVTVLGAPRGRALKCNVPQGTSLPTVETTPAGGGDALAGRGADGAHTQSMSVDFDSGDPPATTTHVSLIAAAAGLPRAAGRGVVMQGVAADACWIQAFAFAL